MNRNLLTAVATLSLSGLACLPVTAQEHQPLKAHVPFAFEVGQTRMSAGDYSIVQERGMLIVRNRTDKRAAVVVTHPVQRKDRLDESYLVFHRVGTSYFLSSAWAEGYTNGGGIAPSSHEREAASVPAASMIAVVKVPVF